MNYEINKYKNSRNMKTLSQITNNKKSFGLKNFSDEEIESAFNECKIVSVKTGNQYNYQRQRSTNYVDVRELYRRIVKY